MQRCLLLCFSLLLIGTTAPAFGLELTPFVVRNLAPPVLVQAAAAAEPARLNQAGRLSTRLGFELASNASLDPGAREAILLDGETAVTTLGLRYGLKERWQVGIDLPWISHNDGFLDSFIENWHDFFGLSNGERDNLPEDELNYRYASINGDSFTLDDETSGPGDVRLMLAWQWLASEQLAASLHTTVKAPTGDADDLTGSEAWDVAVAISAQRDFPRPQGDISIWGGVGATWLGDGEVLSQSAEDWVANGWLGIGWIPLEWLALKLQLDSHSALYDSELDELGDPALILTMGGSLGFGEHTSLDIGVGEDLSVNASPDVTFHLALSHRF